MLTYPNINPDIVHLGPLTLRWYGFMYVIGFIISYYIIKNETKRKNLPISEDDIYDLVFYLIVGVILGGRTGYVLFYNLQSYLADPVQILMINKGGMSFHGGLIGTILAGYIFCRKKKFPFYTMGDIGVTAGALGLGFGRIGNFINAELYGRPTLASFPLAMIFPTDPQRLPRHPSQLYESFFEGFLMFAILLFLSRKNLKSGVIFWSFVMLYGTFRFFIEYTRQPDEQLGILFQYFSMGQLLCLPMIIGGLIMIIIRSKRKDNDQIMFQKNDEEDLPIES